MTPRQRLLDLARIALASVNGRSCVASALAPLHGEYAVVALGKAAASMLEGARSVPALVLAHGFVAHPVGYPSVTLPRSDTWQVHAGGHPLPDAGSLKAGAALVAWLRALPGGLPLLVLMSGGSSACIELPRAGVSLDDLIARTRTLVASGADIATLNAERAEVSQLKRGQALALAGTRAVTLCFISDVPGDDPGVVGSGPFFDAAREMTVLRVADNTRALDAVVRACADRGWPVHERGVVDGDAGDAGRAIARRLRDAAPGFYVWGGETTVVLPARPGRGGRCQQLALAAALELAGHPGVTLLALATDGVDGASDDAGAIVDGGTVARMVQEGFDPPRTLAEADAGSALEAAGDLVHTGPTGTNVMDLVIAIIDDGVRPQTPFETPFGV